MTADTPEVALARRFADPDHDQCRRSPEAEAECALAALRDLGYAVVPLAESRSQARRIAIQSGTIEQAAEAARREAAGVPATSADAPLSQSDSDPSAAADVGVERNANDPAALDVERLAHAIQIVERRIEGRPSAHYAEMIRDQYARLAGADATPEATE